MSKEFLKLADYIASDLCYGSMWHTAMSNEFRKIACRGLARFSEVEALGDFKSNLCFQKLLIDRCNYTPQIEFKIPSVQWSSYKDLPQILQKWEAWETEFAGTLTQAVEMARSIDINIYRLLIDLTAEVQNEAFRVKLCHDNFANSNWDWHHISRANIVLHDYYEKHGDCRKADWNIG